MLLLQRHAYKALAIELNFHYLHNVHSTLLPSCLKLFGCVSKMAWACQVKAFVELVASLLSASISNPSSADGASPPGLAGEMLRVMKETGVLKCLTNALKLVDTDHPQVQHL